VVAGKKFINPNNSITKLFLISITAISGGGTKGYFNYILLSLSPAPCDHDDQEVIFTGVSVFACVILLRINKGTRIQPVKFLESVNSCRHFQCLAV
jgi:hypothetical protein